MVQGILSLPESWEKKVNNLLALSPHFQVSQKSIVVSDGLFCFYFLPIWSEHQQERILTKLIQIGLDKDPVMLIKNHPQVH